MEKHKPEMGNGKYFSGRSEVKNFARYFYLKNCVVRKGKSCSLRSGGAIGGLWIFLTAETLRKQWIED